MKVWGGWLLAIGALGVVLALAMDTSVSTGYGRVNNLGLMQQQQNYLMIAGLMCLVGILMLIFGSNSVADDVDSRIDKSEETEDPFDRIEREEQAAGEADTTARKEYAISIGVRRVDGEYVFGEQSYGSLEEAISAAQEHWSRPGAL